MWTELTSELFGMESEVKMTPLVFSSNETQEYALNSLIAKQSFGAEALEVRVIPTRLP